MRQGQKNTNIRDFIQLTKPRLSALNVIAAWFGVLMSDKVLSWESHLWFLVTITLVIMGSGAINCVLESGLDLKMSRTKTRPLPDGRMKQSTALTFGLILISLGALGLYFKVNPFSSVISLVSAVLYIFAYTPMKLKTAFAVYVGAIPGALPPLIGQVAADGHISLMGWLLFGFLFFWQIPHFIAISIYSRKDYQAAGIQVYPNTHGMKASYYMIVATTCFMVFMSILPYFYQLVSLVYMIVALLLGLCFVFVTLKGIKTLGNITNENSWAKRCFFASILYLPLILCLMFIL